MPERIITSAIIFPASAIKSKLARQSGMSGLRKRAFKIALRGRLAHNGEGIGAGGGYDTIGGGRLASFKLCLCQRGNTPTCANTMLCAGRI